jgi:methylmalonyl-CoA mutase
VASPWFPGHYPKLFEACSNSSGLTKPSVECLRQAVIRDENVFAVLMDAVRVCSLGRITHALFAVGGQYRRSMQGDDGPERARSMFGAG